MKKTILILLIIPIITFSCKQKSETFNIAIVAIVEIDPITDLRKGFKDEFDASEFARTNKYTYKEYNAQNDASIQVQIIDKLTIDRPNMIYVLGTPLAQSIQKRLPDILLVQGTSTDPVAAGLADSWEGSGRKYIATTDLPPIDIQVKLIKALTPEVTKLGVIYNPGEINSIAVINRLKKYLLEFETNIILVERPISNTSEVVAVMNSIIGNVDALYLPPDNTAHAAIPVIGKLANELGLPFYATVESAIEEGALATLSLDFYQMGRETALLALETLNGKDPAHLPIKTSENPVITLNRQMAEKLGISIEGISECANVIVR